MHRVRLAHEGVIPVHLGTLAKRRLVEGNQRVVIFLAQKFRPSFTRVHLDDLIQEGNVALVEAVEQAYHITEGFSTYAATAIRCALVNARVQDLPVSISHDTLYYLRQRNEVKKYFSWQTCSLSQPVEYDSSLTVGDAIVSVSADGKHEDVSEKVVWVEHLLSQLTPLQQQVLRLRYGLDPTDAHEHNTIEVAEKLGIGTSNVSNITTQALNTCRRLYGEDILALALRSQQSASAPKKAPVSHAQQKRRRPTAASEPLRLL